MADITWTPIDVATDFADDSYFEIDARTKQIAAITEQPIVAGENLSQFIKFQMPRYYDAIDLTEMDIHILYQSPDNYKDANAAVNKEYSDDHIRFGWLVPYEACPITGKLTFAIEFVGSNYTLKTVPAVVEVLDSLSGSDIPEPTDRVWYIDLQNQVSAALANATFALSRAEAIVNALSTPASAATAAEMVDTSQVYVYTGSESGYTYGHWYFYDGTAWQSGGAYVSTALYTDAIPTQGSDNAVRSGGVYDTITAFLVSDSVIGEPVTVTNLENVSNFFAHQGNSESSTGVARSYSNDAMICTASGSSQTSPYARHNGAWGEKKWICGFKYKYTKLDPNLAEPTKIRIYLGDSPNYFDYAAVSGEWITFSKVTEVDLTRIYIIVAFDSAPSANSFSLEIKEMYLYDATGINADMCDYIIESQYSDYQDGTVTYGSAAEYAPDTTLSKQGKVPDSKSVGDAISALNSTLIGEIEDVRTGTELLLDENSAQLSNESALSNVSARYGLTKSTVNNVAIFTPSSSPDIRPAVNDTCNLGEGKWLVGFKYRYTKLDSDLGDPDYISVTLGADEKHNFALVEEEWTYISLITSVELTRVYIYLNSYSVAPTSGQMKFEIKDYYVYAVDGVNSEFVNYISEVQNDNFTDGTVTYNLTSISESIKSSFGIINVKNYDVTGDGTTDDTFAINKLFQTYRGNFYFPAGTYKISGTIIIPQGSTVLGDGDVTIFDFYNTSNLDARTFRGSDKCYPYLLVENSYITVKNIKIIGNNTLHTERHYGIGIIDTNHCKIKDVTIYNINYNPNRNDGDPSPVVSAYGIGVLRSTNICIERCYVEQCGYECIGIADYSHDCIVRDCITKNGWRTCIQVHRGAKNVLVQNCYMTQSHEKYDACFTLHGLSGDDLVENLRVENCTAIITTESVTGQQYDYCAPYQFMSDCDGLWCINNRLIGGKRALYVSQSVTNFKMIGNHLSCGESSDYGIKVGSDNAIIIGNVIENEAETGNTISGADVIKVGNIGIE